MQPRPRACPQCGSEALEEDSRQAREFTPFRPCESHRPSMRTRYRLNQNPLNLVEPFQNLARHIRDYLLQLENTEGGSPPADPAAVARLPRVEVDHCVICKEDGGRGMQLPCAHAFHCECIGPWLERHSTCPTCRQNV